MKASRQRNKFILARPCCYSTNLWFRPSWLGMTWRIQEVNSCHYRGRSGSTLKPDGRDWPTLRAPSRDALRCFDDHFPARSAPVYPLIGNPANTAQSPQGKITYSSRWWPDESQHHLQSHFHLSLQSSECLSSVLPTSLRVLSSPPSSV